MCPQHQESIPEKHFTKMMVVPMDRAESVFAAMLCRDFQGVFYNLKTFTWQRRDGIFLGASVSALAVLLYLEWRLPGLLVRCQE
jgi:energy-coupling factor transporter transmembrane protein EcfT